jgi:hypothetical protein
MDNNFLLNSVYDKELNILLGAGASAGLFPTLALNVKDGAGNPMTIESLATHFDDISDRTAYTALFMHYYKECIEPVLTIEYETVAEAERKNVLSNYGQFLNTLLGVLYKKKSGDTRTCNLFTTNYDGCLAHAAEQIMLEGTHDFHMNDGTAGFKRKYLDAKNFGACLARTGAFGRHRSEVAQLNLIHLHGSGYWYKDGAHIRVDYGTAVDSRLLDKSAFGKISEYSRALMDPEMDVGALPRVELTDAEMDEFWDKYNELPIVNPTKWKFHETVFDEHYYQMLRYLSYALETPNSVLLTFGFSFADEHIRNLIRRSLSNPTLQVFVCCYSESDAGSIRTLFRGSPNVQTVVLDVKLDFEAFNERIFTTKSKLSAILPTYPAAPLEAA